MTITVRLDEKTEKKLNWLLIDVNKEPKAYADQKISDIIRTAINNEWVTYNLMHWDDNEKKECDPEWLKKYCTENGT